MQDIYTFKPNDNNHTLPDKDSDDERDADVMESVIMTLRNILMFIIVIAFLFLISWLTSCSTKKSITTDRTEHRVSENVSRIGIKEQNHSVVRQDSSFRQELLWQFESIREHSDTSHYVVQDTAGNIIREKIIINNVKETASNSDHSQMTVLYSRLEKMDSAMRIMQESLQRSDSLLQAKQQTVTKTESTPVSWWHGIERKVGSLVLIALAVLAALCIISKRNWFKNLLRKLKIKN